MIPIIEMMILIAGYLKKVTKLDSCKGDPTVHSAGETDAGQKEEKQTARTSTSATTPTTTCPTIPSSLWRPLWPGNSSF